MNKQQTELARLRDNIITLANALTAILPHLNEQSESGGKHHFWTPEEDRLLQSLVDKNTSATLIGNVMGRSVGSIEKRIELKLGRDVYSSWAVASKSRRFSRRAKAPKHIWTSEENELVKRLAFDGQSLDSILDALGMEDDKWRAVDMKVRNLLGADHYKTWHDATPSHGSTGN